MSDFCRSISRLAKLSSTGEIPWVLDMIRKYHETARSTGAIVCIATASICLLTQLTSIR